MQRLATQRHALAGAPLRRAGGAPAHALRAARSAAQGATAALEAEALHAGGWLLNFIKSKAPAVAALVLGVAGLSAAVPLAHDVYYRRRVRATLAAGVPPRPAAAAGAAPAPLPRRALLNEVRALLAPPRGGGAPAFFHIITGQPGSGKSTLVRAAAAELGHRGIGYFEVPPALEADFGQDLGDAFGFRLERQRNLANAVSAAALGSKIAPREGEGPLASLRRAADALAGAARAYRAETGRPFVLVIDAADRLLHPHSRGGKEEGDKSANGGDVLDALVAYASDWAREGIISVVFVASDWATVEALQGRCRPGGRAGPPLRVGDLSRAEAEAFLAARLPGGGAAGEALAAELAALAGGALPLLERAAAGAARGQSAAEVEAGLAALQEGAFALLLDASPQQEGGLKAAEALLAAARAGGNGIPAARWREAVPDVAHQRALLRSGVFAFDGERAVFGSAAAERFAARRLRALLAPGVAARHEGLRA